MMTPDSRPIGVLTPESLATASHWCIHRKGIADIRPASTLVLRVSDFDDDLPLLTCEGECYWNDDSGWMCYPCTLQPNGLVVPEPWPVLDGEEEIEEWRGMAPSEDCLATEMDGMWDLENDAGYTVAPKGEPITGREGMRPGPRKGKTCPVWVWEADKC